MFTIGICNVCGHWPLRLPGLYLFVLLLLLGNNTKIMINITNAALFWYLVYVVQAHIVNCVVCSKLL